MNFLILAFYRLCHEITNQLNRLSSHYFLYKSESIHCSIQGHTKGIMIKKTTDPEVFSCITVQALH